MLGTKQTSKSHTESLLKELCYINETLNYDLWYPHDSFLENAGYSDAKWAENIENRENTSSACFFVSDYLVA